MTENNDYEDVLEGTVDEAKQAIKDLSDPNFQELLDAEIEGKNRKTLRNWLEQKVEESGLEEGKEEARAQLSMGTLTPAQGLAGGLVIGLLVGILLAGYGPLASGASSERASPSQVQQSVAKLAGAGNPNTTVKVTSPKVRHGMYFVNVTSTQQTANETATQTLGAYVTLDGQLLFPVRRVLGQQVSPINIQERLQQMQQRQQAGNQTR